MIISVSRIILAFLLFGAFVVSIINFEFVRRGVAAIFANFKAPFVAWTFLFVGIFLVSERKSSEGLYLDKFVLFQIAMVSIAGIIVFIGYLSRINKVLQNTNSILIFLFLYGIVGIVSGSYSPSYLLSIYKSSLVIIDVILCAVVLSYQPNAYYIRKLINLSYLFYGFLMFTVIMGALLRPESAFEKMPGIFGFMMQGVLPILNANEVTFIAAVLSLIIINRIFDACGLKEKSLLYTFLACSLSVMVLSQSRTSTLAFFCSYLLILILRKKVLLLVSIILLALLLVVGGTMRYADDYFRRGQTEKNFETLSGRTIAWNAGWEKIKESPVLGYGVGSVRSGFVLDKYKLGHMHNAFLEVLVNTGFVGFMFWFPTLLMVAVTIMRKAYIPPGAEYLTLSFYIEMKALLVCSLIRMMTGEVFVVHNYNFILYICLIAYAVLLRQEKLRIQTELRAM